MQYLASNGSLTVVNACFGAAQALLGGLISLLLYAYLLKAVGASTVGLWTLIMSASPIVSLAGFGMSTAIIKHVAYLTSKRDNTNAANVVEAAFVFVGVSSALLIVIAVIITHITLLRWAPDRLPLPTIALPIAGYILWLGLLTGVAYGALDGCGRMAFRSVLGIGGQSVFFICCFWIAPTHGISAILGAQSAVGTAVLMVAWLALRRELISLSLLPWRIDRTSLITTLRDGLHCEVIALTLLCYDPTTKALLATVGGLKTVALYELASRVLLQLRAVFVSGSQALLPLLASRNVTGGTIDKIYEMTVRLMLVISCIGLCAILFTTVLLRGMALPGNETLITFLSLLAVGWSLNLITVPAYHLNLATGFVRINTLSHLAIGVLNVAFGCVGGWYAGAAGVVGGWMIALAAGSAVCMVPLHIRRGLPIHRFVTSEELWAVGVLIAVTGVLFGTVSLIGTGKIETYVAAAIGYGTMALIGMRHSLVRAAVMLLLPRYSLRAITSQG